MLLCVVTTIVFLFVPRSAYESLGLNRLNATRVNEDPPPPALIRIIGAASRHKFVTEDILDDLLATVGYLAKRETGAR
jgi:hypothetical protein